MVSCSDIEGKWLNSLLISDTTEDVLEDDGILKLGRPDASGDFTGEHFTTGDKIDGHCDGSVNGMPPHIKMRRTHSDGRTITEYEGRVARSGLRGSVIVKGRFSRLTKDGIRAADNVAGDWQTEKPT